MKKVCLYSMLLCLLVACNDRYNPSSGYTASLYARYLKVSPTQLNVPADASKQSLEVTSISTPWILENDVAWISASPAEGSESSSVTLSVKQHSDISTSRLGVMYLTSTTSDWVYSTPVSVTQAAAKPTLSLAQTQISFTGSAGTQKVAYTSNCSWNVTSNADWLSATMDNRYVYLTATANITGVYRYATVRLSASGVTYSISVSQDPASIDVTTDTVKFDNYAASVQIEMTSQAPWVALSSDSWLEVTPETGEAGTSTLTISVAPNTNVQSRIGHVSLYIGSNVNVQIPVFQEGLYIRTQEYSLVFSALQQTQTLHVISNTSWTITHTASWLTVEPVSGTGDAEVSVKADKSSSTLDRYATLYVEQPGVEIGTSLSVRQTGLSFDVNDNILLFDDRASSQSVAITTQGVWRAETNNDWITLTPTMADGDASLMVSVTENKVDKERNGYVYITVADSTILVTVNQQGKYFVIDNDQLSIDSRGGKLQVTISSNDTWTAQIDSASSWLSLDHSSGQGSATLELTATDNPSVNKRVAIVTFTAQNCPSILLVVTQQARYLTLSINEVLMYAKGGLSDVFTVSTDGTYTISCSDTWFAVEAESSDDMYRVRAQANQSTEPRFGSITFTMTDLKEGTYALTLSVIQLNPGGTFLRRAFDEDENYDPNYSSHVTLNITGYGTDENLDPNIISSLSFTITGFKTEVNWDDTYKRSVVITRTGYKEDVNYDPTQRVTGTITTTDYTSDTNYDAEENK